jgi:citrate lyase subunit beta/citryl-CoA lyase
VRINAVGTDWYERDLAACRRPCIAVVMPESSDEALNVYRAQLVLASRVANIAPPIDSPTPQLTDEEVIRRDSARARNLGFGGKLCIHPAQVPIVNAAFSPLPEEIVWTTRVVAAARTAGGAAVAVDGKMIDRPVLDLAERLLAQAARGQS